MPKVNAFDSGLDLCVYMCVHFHRPYFFNFCQNMLKFVAFLQNIPNLEFRDGGLLYPFTVQFTVKEN